MTNSVRNFLDIYAHHFARVAIVVPHIHLASPQDNVTEISRLFSIATAGGAAVVLFPELCLTGYSLDDLHQQEALQASVLDALERLRADSASEASLLIVGAPLRFEGRLFNCAVLMSKGHILGIVPKTYIPNYREYYEKRQFSSSRDALSPMVECLGERVPFGTDMIFQDAHAPDLCVGVEICEDVWAPLSPSVYAVLRGATVIANLSASNITLGKLRQRHQLVQSLSVKTLSAYLYSGAGAGESTTDLAWDGNAMVYECGELLAESERFKDESQIIFADIDLDRLIQERMRMTSFIDCATDHGARIKEVRVIRFHFIPPAHTVQLSRNVERFPFVPSDPGQRNEICYEAFNIQVTSLVQRLRSAGFNKVVIGVSGGLDSTHALMVCARTMDRLGLSRTNILAYTMPGFATSQATRSNALALMKCLDVLSNEIDIRPSCEQMLKDIAHPYARGEQQYDTVFENVQAGARAAHLFRLANQHDALVVGTGDLSELALGWCTYGVGDHMSHYNVNASVPKTLIRYLLEWVADHDAVSPETASLIQKVLQEIVSPELVPGSDNQGPSQNTETIIGPYELQDFNLFYITRWGYAPSKCLFLGAHAWANDVPGAAQDSPYSMKDIMRWHRVFLERFFLTSQFKRSVFPNGPKVGSGSSLSPRGDWRAPSDNEAVPWLHEFNETETWVNNSLSGAQ